MRLLENSREEEGAQKQFDREDVGWYPGLCLYHPFVYTLCLVSGPHSVVVLSRVQKHKLYQFATKEEFFD